MDDEHLPPLGPGKPWLVKDFPVSLREEITRAAAGQGVTVGQWLVAHFQKHGVNGVEITHVYPTPVNAGNHLTVAPSVRSDLTDLKDLVQMARDLSHSADDSLLRLARATVRVRLKACRLVG